MFNYRYLWKWKRPGQSKTVQNKETQRSGSYKLRNFRDMQVYLLLCICIVWNTDRLLQLQKRYTSKNVDSNGKEA